MALIMQLCALMVKLLCLPLHLLDAVGLYQLYKRVYPKFMYSFSIVYNEKMHPTKLELFRRLSEFKKAGKALTLLELGCGSGANFKYFPPGCKVVCTDPNPNFQEYLKTTMAENDQITYEKFVVASGEDMGSVEDESVDVVVCTLVLCSVRDIPQTLREVHRILRPGGAFFFMEHVVADPSTWAHFFQHVLQSLWYYLQDGCHITKKTWTYLESAGFSDLQLRHVDTPLNALLKPHIVGYAVK